MMTSFLVEQRDYILFVYGLGFILTSLVCLNINKIMLGRFKLFGLAAFFMLQGLGIWIDCVSTSFLDNQLLLNVSMVIKVISFTCLFEVGRLGVNQVFNKQLGVWIYFPFLAFAISVGLIHGFPAFYTASAYTFALFGGLMVASVFYKNFRQMRSRRFLFASGLILINALMFCFNISASQNLPIRLIDQDSITKVLGLTVESVGAVCSLLLAYLIWKIQQSVSGGQSTFLGRKKKEIFARQFLIISAVILISGWLAAEGSGRVAENTVRGEIKKHTILNKASIKDQRFKKLTGTSADLNSADYKNLRKDLLELTISDPRIIKINLLLLKNGTIFNVVDSLPDLASAHSEPGTTYFSPPLSLYNVFWDGKTQVIGPFEDEFGSYISGFASVEDEYSQEIIGVVGVYFNTSYLQSSRAQYRLIGIGIALILFMVFVEFSMFRDNSWEASQKLALSEQGLIEAQSIAKIGSWSTEGSGGKLVWSREMFRIFGIAPDSGGPPTFAEFKRFIHPDDLPLFEGAIVDAIRVRGDFKLECRGIRTDQTVIHLYTHGAVRKDEISDSVQFVGITQDISERKAAEVQLQKLSQVIEQSPISIVITGLHGEIEYVNPKFLHLTGYSLEEALGQNPRILKSGKTSPEDYQRLWEMISTRQAWQGEFLNKKKNGDLYWESATIFPIIADNGEITSFAAVKEDITDRKYALDEILFTQDELAKANVELEKASNVKSEFLANMSHEIRTPLNAIIGMTGLLMDTPMNDEQYSFASTVRTSGEVLLSLINDILDFSKIEAQKMDLEEQSFNLRHCVEEALDLINPRAAEKKIELAYLIEEELPPYFIGDVTRLRQIIVNLLSNAVKFTEVGEVVISVEGQVRDNQQFQLHFRVRDTGLGISPEGISRLFKSFSQVDTSTTRRFGGTGLGLAISKRLSEMMGGTMWVESDGIPGRGSTFHFTILSQKDEDYHPESNPSVPMDLSGMKILIVDDNQTNRDILVRYCQAWKMLPTAAASAAETMAVLSSGSLFDIAILDLQMPDLDGISLAEQIRSLLKEKTFPLILLSSLGYRESKGNENRFAAYLTKPIKPSQLFDCLSMAITRRAAPEIKKFESQGRKFDSELGARHPLQILVAEDNSVNQTVALSLLGRLGYRADVVSNGLEAIEALKRQSYDLVFMDGQMPELDGIAASRRIRKEIPAHQQPRIVAMTANAMKGDREKYLAAGMDDYITKPIYIQDLTRALVETSPIVARIPMTAHDPKDQPQLADPDSAAPVDQEESRSELAAENTNSMRAISAVDSSVLLEFKEMLGEDGEETVVTVVELFLVDSPKLIAQMQQSMSNQDLNLMRRAAHTLKGNSSQVGCLPLAALCFELEKMAAQNSWDQAEAMVKGIIEEFGYAGSRLKGIFVPGDKQLQ